MASVALVDGSWAAGADVSMRPTLCDSASESNASSHYCFLHSRGRMEPRDFLRALMARDGDNTHSLAVRLRERVTQPQIHKYLSGVSREPRRTTLQPLAEHYGVSLDAFYDATAATSEATRLGLSGSSVAVIAAEELALYGGRAMGEHVIPQYDAGGAMGRGLVLEAQPPGIIKSWNVSQEWLRLNVPYCTSPENLCIVTGFGNSMVGMYNPGDPLICDTGRTVVDVDGVYFFRVDHHGFIKILQRIPTNDGVILRAKSKNPDYDPFDITPKMMATEGFEVFGKILRAWKSEAL